MAKNKKLPVPTPGRTLSEEDRISIAEAVCDMYEGNEYPLRECLKFYGINSEATWYKWIKQSDEIKERYKKVQQEQQRVSLDQLKRRAESSLMKLITGFTETVEEKTGEVQITEDGGHRIVTTRVVSKEKHYAPSVPAVIFTLTNLDNAKYKRNPDEWSPSEGGPEIGQGAPLFAWGDETEPGPGTIDITQEI